MLFSSVSPAVHPALAHNLSQPTAPWTPPASLAPINPLSQPTLPSSEIGSFSLPTADPETSTQDRPVTVTDSRGRYEFRDVPHGSHQVWIEASTLPAAWQVQAEMQPVKLLVNPGQTLVSEVIGAGVRFTAFYDDLSAAISGVVFVDHNGDGRQTPGEPGLPGVTVIDPGLHQYYVPFNYANLRTMFQNTSSCVPNGVAGSTTAQTIISVVASGDGTTFYYDHWEDGYDTDPTLPGPTTVVGVLDAGQSRIFQNQVNTAALPATPPVFDGRDRVTIVGDPAAVTMLFWLDDPGTVLAGAWEVPEVANWSNSYIVPVGEDLGKDTSGPQGAVDYGVFDYVGLEVMAATPGTVVTVDPDGAGPLAPIISAPLNPGQTLFVPGNVNGNDDPDTAQGIYSGATVTSTAPVQVQVRTGQCTERFSGRSYTLVPDSRWSNDYWAPTPDWGTGTCTTGDGFNHFTDVYIRNPSPIATITINWQNGASSGSFTVPPNSTASFRNEEGFPPTTPLFTAGLHLTSANNFWAVAVADSSSPSGAGANFDWSYALIPINELTSQAILGASPGSFPAAGSSPAGDSGSLAYVMAVDNNTTVFVDLNQDGTPDYFDINGDGDTNDNDVFGNPTFDERTSNGGILLNSGQILRVADPNPTDTRNAPAYFGNSNLNGARIYTTNLDQHLAIAWGEDPCQALIRAPYLDLGYTILPLPTPNVVKLAVLAVDADLTGGVTPGDTISYTLVIHNNGQGSIINPVVVDILPFTYTDYIIDSLAATPPAGVTVTFDNGTGTFTYTTSVPPDSPDPNIQRIRMNLPDLAPGGSVTVTLALLTQLDIPPNVTDLVNGVTLTGDNIAPVSTQVSTPLSQPQLRIQKFVNTATAAPGDTLTYTVVLSNVGNGVAVDTRLSDLLPPLVTYISNSLVLTYPEVVTANTTVLATSTTFFTGGYADDFDNATGFTGGDGNLPWSSDWLPSSADVQVINAPIPPSTANTPPSYMIINNTIAGDDSAARAASLTGFVAPALYFNSATNATAGDAAESLFVDVSINGTGGPWTQVAAFNPPTPAATAYFFQQVDLAAYAGNPNFAFRLRGPGALEAGEFIWIDNVSIVDTDQVRSGPPVPIVQTTSSLTYVTSSNLNPVSLISNTMLITEGVRLPAGGIITASYQVRLPIPLTNGLTLDNLAQVTASNLITIPFPLTDTTRVTIVSSHTLEIDKSVQPKPVLPGGLLTYTLVYTASGNEPAPNTVINDAVPLSTTFVSASGGLTRTTPPPGGTGPIIWSLGDLLTATSGITLQTGVVTFVVQVDPTVTVGVITNTARISDDTGVTDSDDDVTTVTSEPILSLQKSAVDANGGLLSPGDTLTYTIVVANSGVSNATGAVISDNTPANTTFVPGSISIEPTGNGTLGAAPPTLVSGVTITAGQRVTVSFAVTVNAGVPDGTNIVNTASVTSTEVPTPTTGTVTVPVRIAPLLHLDKRVSPAGQTAPGNILTYTLCYSNSGNAPATGVVLTDDIPINTSYVPGSVTTDTGSVEFNDGTTWSPTEPASVSSLRWLIGTLPAASGTRCVDFQIAVNLTISATGGLSVQYSPQGWVVLAGDTTGLDVITYTEVMTPTPAPTAVLTATPTLTLTPEITATPEITPTPEVTPTPEISATPEITVTAAPSAEPTATETPVITPTASLTPTEAPAPPQTTEPISTSTATPLPPTGEPDTPTPAPTDTATVEPAPTDTPTVMPTAEPTEPPPTQQPADGSAFAPVYPLRGWFTALSAVAFPVLWDSSYLAIQTVVTDVITSTPAVLSTSELTLTVTPNLAATEEAAATPTLPAALPPTAEPLTPAPAAEATVSGQYPIVPLSQVAVDIVNTASLGSNETPTLTDTVTVPLLRIVDPVILKRADINLAQPGDAVHFTIEVFNPAPPSNANATNVVVVDALPYLVDLVNFSTSTIPPGVVVNTAVVSQVVPIFGHPNGITQTVASTVTMSIPVLAPNQRVILEMTTQVNALANPGPQTIENIATLTFNEGSVPPVHSTVNVPPPAPPPGPRDRDDNNDNDDDNDNNVPPPPPTSTPLPPAAVQPAPAVLPVTFLPETGFREAQVGSREVGIALLALTIAGGLGSAWLFRRRRRK
ncbi:MAG: DUF11 domain-containing protein [Anaerolineales bacterium]|nr:DUF11 domain-containing protein [Anaerolineales bacterium]